MVKRRLLFSERPDAIRKTELKPCPFCGSNRVCRHYIMGQNRFIVRCFECGITTQSFLDVNDAVKIWNRRAKDQ